MFQNLRDEFYYDNSLQKRRLDEKRSNFRNIEYDNTLKTVRENEKLS